MEETPIQLDHDEEEEDYSNVTLRLYDLSISDVNDFMAWATDENTCKFVSWEPSLYASKKTTIDYFITHVIPHPWYRAICLNNHPIGEIVVTRNGGDDGCRAEVGYSLGSKYWGKGIMTKALNTVAASIFLDWPNLVRLEALVDIENRGSQRVLEKVGFQREGVMRKYYLFKGRPIDMVMFSLLRGDPLISLM